MLHWVINMHLKLGFSRLPLCWQGLLASTSSYMDWMWFFSGSSTNFKFAWVWGFLVLWYKFDKDVYNVYLPCNIVFHTFGEWNKVADKHASLGLSLQSICWWDRYPPSLLLWFYGEWRNQFEKFWVTLEPIASFPLIIVGPFWIVVVFSLFKLFVIFWNDEIMNMSMYYSFYCLSTTR